MYEAIAELKKYANEDTIFLRFLQTLAMIAIFITFIILSPFYLLFGGEFTDRMGRPTLFVAVFLIASAIVIIGMSWLGLI